MSNNISFEHAPLVEIIAELRWLPPGTSSLPPGQAQIAVSGPDPDTFLLGFSRSPELTAFKKAEKLVPPNFPLIWQQAVWRYTNPESPGTLLQVGPGIFTANALQPYKRWSEFRPSVEAGVRALLASRLGQESNQPFVGVSLRYINAFSPQLVGNRRPDEFVREVLGFVIEPPAAVLKLCKDNSSISSGLNLRLRVAGTSKTLALQVGEGEIRQPGSPANTKAILLDFAVAENEHILPDVNAVLESFDAARDIIHSTFMEMTGKIHLTMKPREEN